MPSSLKFNISSGHPGGQLIIDYVALEAALRNENVELMGAGR